MAFGFTPHYTTDLYLDQLTQPQFLILAIDTAGQLGWNFVYISDTGFIALTGGGVFKWKARVTLRIDDEKATLRSESTGSELFDLGKNRKMLQKFTDSFVDARASFSPEALAQKYEALKPNLAPPEQDTFLEPPGNFKGKLGGIFTLFTPRERYFITPILVYINIAVFLIMALSGVNVMEPSSQSLIKWGANVRYYTMDGGWWRLITCCFVHIGILHLLFNMYALVFIGLLLEPYLGKRRFAAAYLLTGIAASMTSLYMHDATISVGASGAIFGMYGVFLAMLTTNVVDKKLRMPMMISIGIFVLYNLVYGLKGGIDNAAHIGGLICGILIGYLYYPGLKNPQNAGLLYSTIVAAALVVLSLSFVIYRHTPDDIVRYGKNMKTVVSLEHDALASIDRLYDDTSRVRQLSIIRDSALDRWNENVRLLTESGKLRVSDLLKQRATILIEYCNLRIASLNYLYGRLESHKGPAPDSIRYYRARINELIASLKANN